MTTVTVQALQKLQ